MTIKEYILPVLLASPVVLLVCLGTYFNGVALYKESTCERFFNIIPNPIVSNYQKYGEKEFCCKSVDKATNPIEAYELSKTHDRYELVCEDYPR